MNTGTAEALLCSMQYITTFGENQLACLYSAIAKQTNRHSFVLLIAMCVRCSRGLTVIEEKASVCSCSDFCLNLCVSLLVTSST